MKSPLGSIPAVPITLAVGQQMPTTTFGPLTRTDFVRYAGASGDFHPIHHDDGYAQAAGLPGVFGMGLLHAGVLGNRVARWVGPTNLRSFSVRFTGQVWPGDLLSFSGRVTGVTDGLAQLELQVSRGGDETVLTARASAVVKT